MSDNENTTIQISNETKQLLDEFGRKGETYNKVILRLLQGVKK